MYLEVSGYMESSHRIGPSLLFSNKIEAMYSGDGNHLSCCVALVNI